MKKLIQSIIISVFLATASYADDIVEMLPGVWWQQVPAVCVDKQVLYDFAFRKELQPLNRSYGRTGGREDGEVVYIVTYWVNIHNDQSMASVQVPGGDYECVLFRTFDMELNPEFDFAPRTDV
jgi:hypothetical protein